MKHNYSFNQNTKKNAAFCLLMLVLVLLAQAGFTQSNPSTFDLSGGAYSMSGWDSLAAAETYPANMVFHMNTSSTSAGFDPAQPGTLDWNCGYNLHLRNRFMGLGSDGFSFHATSSPQFSDCASIDDADSLQRYVGSALLGLNTLNRSSILVSWTGGTVVPGDGNGTTLRRVFTIRLQYRIGTSGNFTDVPGPVECISDTVAGTAHSIGPVTLPVSCENQPVVQLRWNYYQLTTGNGTRPEMRVNDIHITSTSTSGIFENTAGEKGLFVYPNPAEDLVTVQTARSGSMNIHVFNSSGACVANVFTSDGKFQIDRSVVPPGFYTLEITEGNDVVSCRGKLFLK